MAGWELHHLPSFPSENFWTNPQFRLTLLEPDEEEDEDDEEGPWAGWGAAGARPARGGRVPKCTVLLSLIQRNRRCLRAKGLTYLTVGFHVFQVRPRSSRGSAGAEGHRGLRAGVVQRGVPLQRWLETGIQVQGEKKVEGQRAGGDQRDREGTRAQVERKGLGKGSEGT